MSDAARHRPNIVVLFGRIWLNIVLLLEDDERCLLALAHLGIDGLELLVRDPQQMRVGRALAR